MTVYMAVTADKFELPVAVADTAEELAQILGVKAQSVRVGVWRYKNNVLRRTEYICCPGGKTARERRLKKRMRSI